MHSWLPPLSCWPTHHTSRTMRPSCERSGSDPEESRSPCSLRTESPVPRPPLLPSFSASLSSGGELHLESSDALSAAPSSDGLSTPSGRHLLICFHRELQVKVNGDCDLNCTIDPAVTLGLASNLFSPKDITFIFRSPIMLEASISAAIFTLSRDVTKASSNTD